MKKSWEKQQDGVIFKNVCNLGHPNPSILKSHISQWKLKAIYQGEAPMELKYPGSSVKTYSGMWDTQSALSKKLPQDIDSG